MTNELRTPNVDTLRATLLRAVDGGLLAVIFLAPLFMGGRHPLGALMYVAIVCFTAVAWSASQCLAGGRSWIRSGAEVWLILCVLLVVVQIVPLPWWLLSRLSPAISDLLPFWSGDTDPALRLGTWSQLSLMPAATREGLIMLLAHGLLFLVVVQRVRKLGDVQWLLRCLAGTVIAMAALGLVQLLFSNGRFLWIYEHPFRDTRSAATGAFINCNHFAHFLALGVAPLIWWLAQTAAGRDRQTGRTNTDGWTTRRTGFAHRADGDADRGRRLQTLLALALGVVLFAGLLTFSRGGVIVVLLAVGMATYCFARQGLLGRRTVTGLVSIGLVLAAAVLIFGYEPLARELASLGAGSIDEVDQNSVRRSLWAADLEAFSQFPLLGTGGGSHAEVYPLHFDHHVDVRYSHAESGYIQVLLEYGLAGAVLLLTALGVCGLWCARIFRALASPALQACAAAVVTGLVASVIHSIWDFVWYIPACMSLTVILAACACRLSQLAVGGEEGEVAEGSESGAEIDPREAIPRPRAEMPVRSRLGWAAATVGLAATGVAMAGNLWAPVKGSAEWEQYLAVADSAKADAEAVQDHETNDAALWHLQNTLAADPNNERAHLRMATALLLRFEIAQQSSINAMPLYHIRDVVLASDFPTAEARDQWLTAAVGENLKLLHKALFHTYRALQLCPLQGEAYIYLAELDFLRSARAERNLYVAQALRLRPNSGMVLMAAGVEAAQHDDMETATGYWKTAFHQNPLLQSRLIEVVAPHMPPSVFIPYFQPDGDALGRLFQYYRDAGDVEHAFEVGRQYVARLEQDAARETGQAAARLWYRAYEVHRQLGNEQEKLACIGRAVECSPRDFDMRRTLGLELLAAERFDEAVEQFRWCLSRRPQDAAVKYSLTKATRGRLERTSAMTSAAGAKQRPPK